MKRRIPILLGLLFLVGVGSVAWALSGLPPVSSTCAAAGNATRV
jgi:hypothetical protein